MKSFAINENVKFKDEHGNWKYGVVNSFNWESDTFWITVTDANGLYEGMMLISRENLFESNIFEKSCTCGSKAVGSTRHSWYCTVTSK